MECDSEKLIALIENRPAIYNYKLKEHNNRNFVDYLWTEIAKEMKCDVIECKTKWTSLRNSYARTIRQDKHSKPNKKRWYLAGTMSFMKEYMRYHRAGHRHFNFEDPESSNAENACDETTSTPSQHAPSPLEMQQFKREKSVTIDEPAPNIEPPEVCTAGTQEENENLTFFKGLLPDIKKLTARNQRTFRKEVFQKLMDIFDEQDFGVEGVIAVEKRKMQ